VKNRITHKKNQNPREAVARDGVKQNVLIFKHSIRGWGKMADNW